MELIHTNIEKAIHRSQHCQRNWDLSREIPQEDLDLLITAATECPSKQNLVHYKVHAITNRDIIEEIHNKTDGFTVSYFPSKVTTTNSQVLANLLLVIESTTPRMDAIKDLMRNDQFRQSKLGLATEQDILNLERDKNQAVGIAAGYLNLTASLLGYGTGCCACFDVEGIKTILGLENDPILLMGIGYKNPELNRRIHHKDHSFMFPTKQKQEIEVKVWK